MATIPIGNFGGQIAAAAPAPQIPQGNPLDAATQGLQNTAQSIIGQEQERQKQLDMQSQRADAALALAKVNNALHDAHDVTARGVADGSIDIDKAPQVMQDQTAKIREQFTSGLLPLQRQAIDDNIETTSGALNRSLTGVIVKRKQSETGAVIDQFGDQIERDAMRSGPAVAAERYKAMVQFSGSAAGWNPEVQQAKIQAKTEKITYTFFDAAGTGAFVAGDVDAIQKVRDQMAGPKGEPMDPQKRIQLDHQLFGYQQHILASRARAANQAEEEDRKRYNEAVDGYNQGLELSLGGAYMSPDFIKEITTKAQGTAMQQPVLDLIASQAQVAGFATRSADQRADILNAMRAERATPGVGVGPTGEKLLKAAETMDAKLRDHVNQNPWEAAQSAGVIKDAGELHAGNPGDSLVVIQKRMQDIGRIEVWAGKKVSPLQPQEVEQVGKMVRSMPIDRAAGLLAQIGASIGDQERVAAVAKQMGDKDGTLGMAMMYANQSTTQGRYTAELLLRGEQAIKDKVVKTDGMQETGWRAQIANQVRGAYSNRQVEDNVVNAAFLIMAARSADPNQGNVNIDNAVRLATGGGIVDRNGSKVPLPQAMSESDFDKAIKGVKATDLEPQAPGGVVYSGKTPIPLADFVAGLPNAQLVHAGQGMYNVKTGTSVVVNAQGQRVTIKVKQ